MAAAAASSSHAPVKDRMAVLRVQEDLLDAFMASRATATELANLKFPYRPRSAAPLASDLSLQHTAIGQSRALPDLKALMVTKTTVSKDMSVLVLSETTPIDPQRRLTWPGLSCLSF